MIVLDFCLRLADGDSRFEPCQCEPAHVVTHCLLLSGQRERNSHVCACAVAEPTPGGKSVLCGYPNPGGITPMIWKSLPSRRKELLSICVVPENIDCQRAWLMTTTLSWPGRSSSGPIARPVSGKDCRVEKKFPSTRAPPTRVAEFCDAELKEACSKAVMLA